MEQFFQDNHLYFRPIRQSVHPPAPTTPPPALLQFHLPDPATATTYTLTATGKSSMTGFTYTLDQANVRKQHDCQPGTVRLGTCTGHLLDDQQGRWLLKHCAASA
jgi:hypothetical protein